MLLFCTIHSPVQTSVCCNESLNLDCNLIYASLLQAVLYVTNNFRPKGYTKAFKFEILSDKIAVFSAFIISNSVQCQWWKNDDDDNICCNAGNIATISQIMQEMAAMIMIIIIVTMVETTGDDGRSNKDSNGGGDNYERRGLCCCQ